jgi:hypothetical protein
MTMTARITSGQKDQFKRFAEDAAKKALEQADLDRAGMQCLFARGDEFQTYFVEGVRKFSKPKPVFADADNWVDFYRRIFGIAVDLAALQVPAKPNYPCWSIVMVPGITTNQAFEACSKAFGTWKNIDINGVRDIVERPKGAYVVWVKANIEADPDLANVSAEQIFERGLNTLTLRERIILELKYWDGTKQHLDIDNWTLCAGSRCADGGVPRVGWGSGARELDVDWCSVQLADSYLRARAAVS